MTSKTLALIHTSATLVPVFAALCKEKLPGVTIFNIVDDSLVSGIRKKGSRISAGNAAASSSSVRVEA